MDFASQLGKNIKNLREAMKLSQNDLAEGICSQACISRIEKGKLSPTAEILYKIAMKLRVDINYLFDLSSISRFDYVNDVFLEIRVKIRYKEYEEVKRIISVEKKNPLFYENLHNKQFLKWHEGICIYYLEKNVEKAIQRLDESLTLLRTTENDYFSEREVEILLSKGIIFSEEGQYHEAIEIYQECLNHLNSLPKLNDFRIKIRVLYNLTKTLIEMKELDQALIHCDQGIQLCIDNETLYLFAELFFQKGRIYKKKGDFLQAIHYMKKANFIFSLTNRTKYISAVSKIISEISLENNK